MDFVGLNLRRKTQPFACICPQALHLFPSSLRAQRQHQTLQLEGMCST